FIHARKLGNVGAVLWELQPFDRDGRVYVEAGITSAGVGLVGIGARIFEYASVGYGVPVGKHPARAEPYVCVHLPF
ncbi:MAG: hypothetical protein H5T86_16345, partial [Armatimonadetes bacterium]|nr:hypothetical protein [Armatimonadota bacterium]